MSFNWCAAEQPEACQHWCRTDVRCRRDIQPGSEGRQVFWACSSTSGGQRDFSTANHRHTWRWYCVVLHVNLWKVRAANFLAGYILCVLVAHSATTCLLLSHGEFLKALFLKFSFYFIFWRQTVCRQSCKMMHCMTNAACWQSSAEDGRSQLSFLFAGTSRKRSRTPDHSCRVVEWDAQQKAKVASNLHEETLHQVQIPASTTRFWGHQSKDQFLVTSQKESSLANCTLASALWKSAGDQERDWTCAQGPQSSDCGWCNPAIGGHDLG